MIVLALSLVRMYGCLLEVYCHPIKIIMQLSMAFDLIRIAVAAAAAATLKLCAIFSFYHKLIKLILNRYEIALSPLTMVLQKKMYKAKLRRCGCCKFYQTKSVAIINWHFNLRAEKSFNDADN